MDFKELKQYDEEIYASTERELRRQQQNIELIASENIVSKGVLLAARFVSNPLLHICRLVPVQSVI